MHSQPTDDAYSTAFAYPPATPTCAPISTCPPPDDSLPPVTGASYTRYMSGSQQVWAGRAVLHVDMDAFFATVEQLDHPAWRGLPVIVGGPARGRGVVSTASYEARRFGVRSAMPSAQAVRLCPDAIWAPARFERYHELSDEARRIFLSITPHVQPVSI